MPLFYTVFFFYSLPRADPDLFLNFHSDSKPRDVATVATSIRVLDNMAVNDVRDAFRKKDKQWLNNHQCFGSQNLVPSNDSESNMVLPTSNQCSKVGWSLSKDVFNFKKKPRVQRVKRKWHANLVSLKQLSSEGDEDPKPESSEIEEDNVSIAVKRLRKPTRRYAEEFMEQDLRHQKKKCGAFSTEGQQKRHHNRCERKRFIHRKESFNGECIQVPFGEPVIRELTEEKVRICERIMKVFGCST